MTTIEVSDPELMQRAEVKDDGRIYVGTDLAGQEFELVLARISE